jgi:hypothetical protein
MEAINRGIEVEILTNFSTIRETLERIGIVRQVEKTLYPSCYILSKRDKYYIIHFKNLYVLDGKKDDVTENDMKRQTAITKLLEKWGMVKIVDASNVVSYEETPFVYVLPFEEKLNYTISHKYKIGKK